MKEYIIAGNWKMNLNYAESINLAQEIESGIKDVDFNVKTVLCIPYLHIPILIDKINNSKIRFGAQNCHHELSGAFTGEISAAMLHSIGCEYVIIGHSERRQYFRENNELINQKLKVALFKTLKPILCIGETYEEYNANKTFEVIGEQLRIALEDIDVKKLDALTVAYEPVWAIGTGLTPENDEILAAHNKIRNLLVEQLGSVGVKVKILYGGSLNEKNASEILAIENVNGGLIGGASLKANSYLEIINIANSYSKN